MARKPSKALKVRAPEQAGENHEANARGRSAAGTTAGVARAAAAAPVCRRAGLGER